MMPKKAESGKDTAGLLVYLYGPGRRDEHVDAHMVAAWDAKVEDPARSVDMTLSDLALLLDVPVYALLGRKPSRHVYHVAVRNPPEDRVLSDAEWAEVAAEMMHAAGISEHGDDQGCRWVAVRHAEDHIHIVATLARQDGRQPNLRQDIVKMQAAARLFEDRWGLRALVSGDRTAVRWPKTGEREKAAQRGLAEPPRVTLRRTVREVAAVAAGDEDFFSRLGTAGVRVKQRIAPDGAVTGYAVALPGDRDGQQAPVWFSGAKLAADLSLPRVRERWQGPPAAEAIGAEVWRVAEERVRAAEQQLGVGGLHRGAGEVAALGDVVAAAGARAPGLVREQLRRAAEEFERAGRAPTARTLEGEARELLRSSARELESAPARSDVAAMLGFLVALAAVVAAAQRWHEAQGHRAQAQAAGRAGRSLREAVEVTVGAVAGSAPVKQRSAGRSAGSNRSGAERVGVMVAVVQEALPAHAAAVLADSAWPALRERLLEVAARGEEPARVLESVAGQRELGSAESVAEVLTWRLDGWRRSQGGRRSAQTASPRSSGGRKMPAQGPVAGVQRGLGPEQRGPRRAR